jgi:hypothetical protein
MKGLAHDYAAFISDNEVPEGASVNEKRCCSKEFSAVRSKSAKHILNPLISSSSLSSVAVI